MENVAMIAPFFKFRSWWRSRPTPAPEMPPKTICEVKGHILSSASPELCSRPTEIGASMGQVSRERWTRHCLRPGCDHMDMRFRDLIPNGNGHIPGPWSNNVFDPIK